MAAGINFRLHIAVQLLVKSAAGRLYLHSGSLTLSVYHSDIPKCDQIVLYVHWIAHVDFVITLLILILDFPIVV